MGLIDKVKQRKRKRIRQNEKWSRALSKIMRDIAEEKPWTVERQNAIEFINRAITRLAMERQFLETGVYPAGARPPTIIEDSPDST
jgi:hypothetical protein